MLAVCQEQWWRRPLMEALRRWSWLDLGHLEGSRSLSIHSKTTISKQDKSKPNCSGNKQYKLSNGKFIQEERFNLKLPLTASFSGPFYGCF